MVIYILYFQKEYIMSKIICIVGLEIDNLKSIEFDGLINVWKQEAIDFDCVTAHNWTSNLKTALDLCPPTSLPHLHYFVHGGDGEIKIDSNFLPLSTILGSLKELNAVHQIWACQVGR